MQYITRNIIYIVITGFFSLLFYNIQAQDKVYVVSKSSKKTFDYDYKTDEINIEAINANIQINSWDENKLKAEVKIIAKHKDLDVAKKEIRLHNSYIIKSKNNITIKNVFNIDKSTDDLEAFHIAEYSITVPSKCKMVLSNSFGQNNIKGISGILIVNAEYGQINLTNVSGIIKIYPVFADINVDHISGDISILGKHSNIQMNGLYGKYNIKNRFGQITIGRINKIDEMNLNATTSEITFFPSSFYCYNYDLLAISGFVNINKKHLSNNSYTIKESFVLNNNENNPLIYMRTSYKNINIE